MERKEERRKKGGNERERDREARVGSGWGREMPSQLQLLHVSQLKYQTWDL